MSYYKPSFSQTIAMTRGRGGYSNYSPRGGGGSHRGGSRFSNWNQNTGYSNKSSGHNSRYVDYSNSNFEGRRSDHFSRQHNDDYHKSYRDGAYSREHRSPDRKRQRTEAPSSRHESSYGYASSRYESGGRGGSYSDRRSFDRHSESFSRKEDFRRPAAPVSRGGFRGRLSSRGSRGLPVRDRLTRRLLDRSYGVKKRGFTTVKSSDFVRKFKISKMRSEIAKRGKPTGSGDDDSNSGDEAIKNESETKQENLNNSSREEDKTTEGAQKADTDNEKGDNEDDDTSYPKKSFIKLECPHCKINPVTFKKYELHLRSRLHSTTMRRVAYKQKMVLAQMRHAQRNKQNELEKNGEVEVTGKTNFCPLCKLNYKQKKSVHQASEGHINMKSFLLPFCKICNTTFQSPMIYQTHCCSIEHIKRKQRVENGTDGSEEDTDENLAHFTTIDSVGDETEEKEKKVSVNVGVEKIRKVEAYYCDLCKMYLQRGDESEMEKIVTRHCKQRVHMQRYIRYKEDKELERKASKLQREETEEKKKLQESAENSVKKEEGDKEKDDGDDQDLWVDLDKDLGDILAEAEEDEEDGQEDKRNDDSRFKNESKEDGEEKRDDANAEGS